MDSSDGNFHNKEIVDDESSNEDNSMVEDKRLSIEERLLVDRQSRDTKQDIDIPESLTS